MYYRDFCDALEVTYSALHAAHDLVVLLGDININLLEVTYSALHAAHDLVVLLGDININLLNGSSPDTAHFTHFLESFDLHQLITQPIRITATSLSLIDVIVDSDRLADDTSGVDVSVLADHNTVYCVLNINIDSVYPVHRISRNFSHMDNDCIRLPSFPGRKYFTFTILTVNGQ
ncbi:hypothetical protein QE152_g9399 [Popillia japonica]|uniref:Endonuclease/exonuclease/phosphatase domain-containing protein n=1 Tax=Popillia japonica TaxID=7064 RepID=A0AAW1LWZ0_POPJA